MSILESKNGQRLHLAHLGVELSSFSMTQRHDGTVFEMEGSSMGGSEFSDQALHLMMGPGFSAGDEVEWKDEREGEGSVTVTVLQWEYHPALDKTTFGDYGRNRFERTPHRWKLWIHQKPASAGGDNPPPLPLGFLRPGR